MTFFFNYDSKQIDIGKDIKNIARHPEMIDNTMIILQKKYFNEECIYGIKSIT